jgi:hypothetical protein
VAVQFVAHVHDLDSPTARTTIAITAIAHIVIGVRFVAFASLRSEALLRFRRLLILFLKNLIIEDY